MANNNELVYQSVLPHDTNAEEAVIGTIIRRNELYAHVEDILLPESFYDEVNAAVFRCVRWVIRSGRIADINSVIEATKSHKSVLKLDIDESKIYMLASKFSERTFSQDVERLVSYARRRQSWTALQLSSKKLLDLTEDVDDTLGEAQKSIDTMKGMGSIDDSVLDAKAVLKRLNGIVQANMSGESTTTVKTGYRFTDDKGIIRIRTLTVIASFSGYGKTALALCMAQYMAVIGVPVAYYSMEMGAEELWARLLSGASSMTSNKLLTGKLSEKDVERLDQAMNQFSNLPIYIDENATISVNKILRSIRTLVKKYGVRVVFIDYIQILVQTKGGEREEASLGAFVRELKNISKELDICVIALSQLRRDKDEMHPRMDMLRGSGQIEESADNVILLDRPSARPEWGVLSYKGIHANVSTKGTAEIILSKGRGVGTGSWIVGFTGWNTRFFELDEIPYKDSVNKKRDNTTTNQTQPVQNTQTVVRQEAPVQPALPFENTAPELPF